MKGPDTLVTSAHTVITSGVNNLTPFPTAEVCVCGKPVPLVLCFCADRVYTLKIAGLF